MPPTRHPLPIDAVIPQLVESLFTEHAVIVKAPPGSGKSTRVPSALLGADWLGNKEIWMLEPRRIAARATASRIAEEQGSSLGDTIGYQVRFEKLISARTQLRIVTEGVATRSFIRDPFLENVGCLVLDEFHERSVDTDLCLAFAKELLSVRDDFRLVVMSATMDTEKVSKYLQDARVLTCESRTHPLHINYFTRADKNETSRHVVQAIQHLLDAPDDDGGDILVFLSGAAEIHRSEKSLATSHLSSRIHTVPLYGALPFPEQQRALKPGHTRRVVLATNIAETSLTVPGVSAVVDTGLERRSRINPRTGLDGLETVFISRESADQRAGRAGRLQPGRVIRLWSKVEHHQLQAHRPPELQRIDLAPTLLAILSYQPGEPGNFDFFEAPSHAQMQVALRLLQALNAIEPGTKGWRLTQLGESFSRLPVHPRVAAMLHRAEHEQIVPAAASIAAILSERDFVRDTPQSRHQSINLLDRYHCFEALFDVAFDRAECKFRNADERAAKNLSKVRAQLLRAMPKTSSSHHDVSAAAIGRILAAAFPDRICIRAANGATEAKMVGGRGVTIRTEDDLKTHHLFVAPVMDDPAGAKRSFARIIFPIDVDVLRAVFPDRVTSTEDAHFDPLRKAVSGVRQLRFDDLILEEKHGVRVHEHVLEQKLVDAAVADWEEAVVLNEDAKCFENRLRFAQKHLPEEPWPVLSAAWYQERLTNHCASCRSFDDLKKIPWLHELKSALTWPQQQLLDAEVPERMVVPSGSRIQIDYESTFGSAEAPVLAVRLQETFGLMETPTLAKGRVKILLHLLAPNLRPVQVTKDIRSFWDNTYQSIRKELRQRYPKHAWPEDPLTAVAESRPRRKR